MPPKVRATPEEVERQFKDECKRDGKVFVPYDKSYLAKKPSNGANADLTGKGRI